MGDQSEWVAGSWKGSRGDMTRGLGRKKRKYTVGAETRRGPEIRGQRQGARFAYNLGGFSWCYPRSTLTATRTSTLVRYGNNISRSHPDYGPDGVEEALHSYHPFSFSASVELSQVLLHTERWRDTHVARSCSSHLSLSQVPPFAGSV